MPMKAVNRRKLYTVHVEVEVGGKEHLSMASMSMALLIAQFVIISRLKLGTVLEERMICGGLGETRLRIIELYTDTKQ